MSWWNEPARPLDERALAAAARRQDLLTKPPGSLGRLEEIAIRLAGLYGQTCPSVDPVRILVFAGDHGIAANGVSAFPQSVTAQMVLNMAAGGAAISVLAKELAVSLELVVLGTVGEIPNDALSGNVKLVNLASCTSDFSKGPAMSETELDACLDAGRQAVDTAAADGCRLAICGEMGIANSTPATALACALLNRLGVDLTGPGTGLDRDGVTRKAKIIDRALALHARSIDGPLAALRCVGGFEIAALAAAYLRAAQLGIPSLVDGFIATSAALAACRIQPGTRDWLFFGHRSREPGHRLMLDALNADPILDLGLRLGEGSGAAAALPLLRLACRLHAEMASFAEANVDGALQ